MSKKVSPKTAKKAPISGYQFIQKVGDVEEYLLRSNNLRVLYLNRPDTGVVTTNITYLVGARDEKRGETGVAHMLEHMLFKPTTSDKKRGVKEGGAMHFERETGCILNANTWKDRTTYFFSYPKEHTDHALQIEAERMDGVVLNDKELTPEQGNVLSEFDMYNGDPYFALEVQMVSTAFHSHPYGHETIGYREDIENYTPKIVERFYRDYYRPDNAVMMVIGDLSLKEALTKVKTHFGKIQNPSTPIPRFSIREPKQEGLRRVTIERPSNTNIVNIAFKHAGFPTKDWFTTATMLSVLVDGPESILHKLLVDTGKCSSVDSMHEPTSEVNISSIILTLAPGQKHEEVESLTRKAIASLDTKSVASLAKKVKARTLTDELFAREHSLKITQELTEYVASGQWETYAKTPEILMSVSNKDLINAMQDSFTENKLTIGHFKGTA